MPCCRMVGLEIPEELRIEFGMVLRVLNRERYLGSVD